LTTRFLVLVGGPGKTTLARYLAKQTDLFPLLLVDHALSEDLDALFKLVAADDLPSLAQMQLTPQYDLQQTECLLAEGLTSWGKADVDMLKAGQPLQPLTPLWKSACKRLFSQYKTVVLDDWQPAWTPWLPDCTILALGAYPPEGWHALEAAGQLGWLQVEQPGELIHVQPYEPGRAFWPKVGRVPWVPQPVRKQPPYQQAIQAMLGRLG
jgi:hypothetical protein